MGKELGRIWKPKDIARYMNSLFGIDLSYKQAWRAKQHAFQLMIGPAEDTFSQLPIYFHNLRKYNPGTVTYIETDSEDRFECCFFAIGCMIRAFRETCRRVVIMDGAHLKWVFKGCVLHAVAMDGNNQIFPLGFGICKSESIFSWSWFLEKLHECIGDLDNLTFVTDRAPSILTCVANVFPNAFHAYCAFHILPNIRRDGGRGLKTKVLWWELVKAFKTSDFDKKWFRFCRVRPNVAAFLAGIQRERWSRAYCPTMRYDYLTSNCAESMNALSKHARKLPVTTLIEFFRATMQKWYFERRRLGADSSTLLTKWAESEVKKEMDGVTGWTVCGVTDAIYEVHDFRSGGIVNLRERTCSCMVWQLTGLPCGHLLMVLKTLNQENSAHMASAYYHIETYRSTYSDRVYPLPAESCDWEAPENLMIVRPPLMESQPSGRPRNTNRIPSQGEEPRIRECTRCGTRGHTRTNCPAYAPTKKTARSRNRASGSGTVDSQTFATFDLNQP